MATVSKRKEKSSGKHEILSFTRKTHSCEVMVVRDIGVFKGGHWAMAPWHIFVIFVVYNLLCHYMVSW